MNIKNLVIGGGGGGGFSIYGALKYLLTNNYIQLKNIETIDCVSIGSVIALLITLDIDFDILDNYLIKRPWEKVFEIKASNILNLWSEKGCFELEHLNSSLLTLLKLKNISENITLKEYYEYTNIELYIVTCEINNSHSKKVILSYKTHPDLGLIKAIYMSSTFPILFKPVIEDDKCFIDGGLINNFPLNHCLERVGLGKNTENQILAIKIVSSLNKNSNISNDTNLLWFIYLLLDFIRKMINDNNIKYETNYILECKMENNSIVKWKEAIYSENLREEIINTGVESAKQFLENNSI